MSSSSDSEDEDIKVRKRLDRKEKIENDPIALKSDVLDKTGLTLEELRELQEIFQLVDLDHSGAISKEELKSLMDTLGLRVNQMELDHMVSETDPDGTGEIDFESFAKTVSKRVQTAYTFSDMERAFKKFCVLDESTDGKLSMKTLIDALVNYGQIDKRLSRDEAVDLINQVSSEKQTDYFDYPQFLSLYFK